jgi:hypothetical protein
MMNRKEQISLSILKNLELSNGRMMREEILHRIVMLELAHLQVSTTEIKQSLQDAEMKGKIASDRDGYGNVSFVLTSTGKAELLSRG